MRKKNCLFGRSLTMSVAQSTPVAATSLLPPLKIRCTNGGVRLCQVFRRSTRRRRSNHVQSICVAERCAFLCGLVNTGDGDTALISTSDGRSCRLVYVDATFRVHGAFVILSAIYGLRPAHLSLVSGVARSHDPENNCTASRRLQKAACINTTIS